MHYFYTCKHPLHQKITFIEINMKASPPLPESDNESTLIMPVRFDEQNLADKLMPRLKLLPPKIIFLYGFIQSIVSGIDIVFHFFHTKVRSITNAILIYCLILTPLGAQEIRILLI